MLIATDLDGTLVPHDRVAPSARTAEVLERADCAGIPIVFVTARPLRWMEDFWPHVGRHGLAIVSNGAVVYDAHAREPIAVHGLDPEVGLAVTEAITRTVPGATYAIECLDGIRRDPEFVEQYRVPEGSPVGPLEEIWDVPALKLLVRHPGMDDDDLRAATIAAVGTAATATWSVGGLVEISAAGVTKASALVELCARLGIVADDVVAFGDMPNDIPMLAWAGTSYAMAGAHPDVVAAADHLAPPCAEDGVAQVVERLLG
ncbi:HAD family hydrolase [Nocardioides sp. MH1]|uniref:HAD family hydrolase n=1 Tax=Nocardioides sp. MH1 TaxID=3242490 RepID=UPI00352151F1